MIGGSYPPGAGRLVMAAAAAAVLARAALRAPHSGPWRTNFRGRPVSLAAGPALAAGATVAAVLAAPDRPTAGAALLAGVGCAAVGRYDDLVGGRPEQRSAKGFAGHLSALRSGRLTSGLVKLVGVGAAGLGAAALLAARPGRSRSRPGEVLLGAGVVAGTANLVNLLDLRPGRALKAVVLLGTPLAIAADGTPPAGARPPAGAALAGARPPAGAVLAAAATGAAAGLLADDLRERAMIGDCGANAVGALLGVALVARLGPAGRAAALAALVALTAASERVSFSAVIERTPPLRALDRLGRLPD